MNNHGFTYNTVDLATLKGSSQTNFSKFPHNSCGHLKNSHFQAYTTNLVINIYKVSRFTIHSSWTNLIWLGLNV